MWKSAACSSSRRESWDLLGTHRSLLVEQVGIPREVPELEVNVDAGFCTSAKRYRNLIVAGGTVAAGVDAVDG